MLNVAVTSKKDMAHSKDRMPGEIETCDMKISVK